MLSHNANVTPAPRTVVIAMFAQPTDTRRGGFQLRWPQIPTLTGSNRVTHALPEQKLTNWSQTEVITMFVNRPNSQTTLTLFLLVAVYRLIVCTTAAIAATEHFEQSRKHVV